MNDLVSYDHKHNEANQEGNRDGADHNESWNCGAEGPTDDVGIQELRKRKQRAMLATLLLSQGVPMLLSGDEVSHSQQGNNNTYCQDNELTWLNRDFDDDRQAMLDFVTKVIQIRHSQPVFQRRRFLHGKEIHGENSPEIDWLEPCGNEMSPEAWNDPHVRCLGVHLCGGKVDVDEYGESIIADHILMLFNADHGQEIEFTLPKLSTGDPWELLFDTSKPTLNGDTSLTNVYKIQSCSVVVLRSPVEQEDIDAYQTNAEVVLKKTH